MYQDIMMPADYALSAARTLKHGHTRECIDSLLSSIRAFGYMADTVDGFVRLAKSLKCKQKDIDFVIEKVNVLMTGRLTA